MMKMKYVTAAVVAASAALITPPAYAVTIVSGKTLTFNGTNGAFSADVSGSGAFSTPFTFNVGSIPGTAGLTLSSVAFGSSSLISNLKIAYNDTAITLTPTSIGSGFSYQFGAFTLPVSAGVQNFTVSGTITQSGSFAGTLGFASAAPEPATWAMMILGVGIVGYAMRRRQRITTRVAFG